MGSFIAIDFNNVTGVKSEIVEHLEMFVIAFEERLKDGSDNAVAIRVFNVDAAKDLKHILAIAIDGLDKYIGS